MLAIEFCTSICTCVSVVFYSSQQISSFRENLMVIKPNVTAVYRIAIRSYMQKRKLLYDYIIIILQLAIDFRIHFSIFSMQDRYGILAREISYKKHNTKSISDVFICDYVGERVFDV